MQQRSARIKRKRAKAYLKRVKQRVKEQIAAKKSAAPAPAPKKKGR